MSLIANWETNPLLLKYYNYIFSQLNVHIKFFEHHNKVIFSVSQIIANCQVWHVATSKALQLLTTTTKKFGIQVIFDRFRQYRQYCLKKTSHDEAARVSSD